MKRGNPFPKGESGNPGGRPKLPRELVERARAHSVAALDVLVSIAKDVGASPAARVSAATAIIDRGFGRPAQTINATVRRSAAQLTDAELEAIIAGHGETGDLNEFEDDEASGPH